MNRRIIKLAVKQWWHRSLLLHVCACIVVGCAAGAAILYVLCIMLAPIIQQLNAN